MGVCPRGAVDREAAGQEAAALQVAETAGALQVAETAGALQVAAAARRVDFP